MKNADLNQLYKIAVMYYREHLTQEEIAKVVGISRPQISRALAKAIEVGIVEIRVIKPKSTESLEDEVREALGIKRVYLAPVSRNTIGENDRTKDISDYGSIVLQNLLKDKRKIGIGWGKTVYETILKMDTLPPSPDEKPTIVPIVGSLGYLEAHYQVNVMVGILSNKLNGLPLFFNVADKIVERTEEASKTLEQYSELQEAWSQLDTAVIGLGPYPMEGFPEGSIIEEWMGALKKSNPKGDIVGRFFNDDGYIHDKSIRFLGIPEDELKRVETAICLSGGSNKIEAITTAARLGYMTHLITDMKTAEEIIEYKERNK